MPKNHSRITRLARIAVSLMAIAVAITALTGTGIAAAKVPANKAHAAEKAHAAKKSEAAKKAHSLASLPDQGIFDSCDITVDLSTCEQDLQAIHQAGLKVVVTNIPLGATLDEITQYATAAQSAGVSVMWELNDAGFWGGTWTANSAGYDYSEFATPCGCTDTTQVLQYMIQSLAALPATYGYYAADDWTLSPDDTQALTQYVSEIKAADPSHMVMIGSAVSQGTSFYRTGATIGNEIYPETTSDLMPVGRNLASWDSVEQGAAQDQHAATNHGSASAFILQSFTFGDSLADGEAVGVCTEQMSEGQCANLLHYPSAAVQLQLRNEVLEHAHPKLILWYTFSQTYGQGDRWTGLTSAVKAPYPVTATVARAKHSKGHRRAAERKHRKHRHAA
jgi:hypothetical protein